VRLLHLAAHEGESRVDEALAKLLEQRQPLSEQVVRTLLGKDTPLSVAAQVCVAAVDLRQYDALLEGGAAMSDIGMSNTEPNKEVNDEPGQGGGADALPAGAAFGGGTEPVRGSGAQATAESWGYTEYLLELMQRECQQRQHHRIERLLKASKLALEKTWATLDLKRLPTKAGQQLRSLLSGDFLDRRENVLVFGPPGSGKSHALNGLSLELVRAGRRVLFTSAACWCRNC